MNTFVGVLLIHRRTITRELADIGEGVQQRQLRLHHRSVLPRHRTTQSFVLGEQDTSPRRTDIETGDQRRQLLQPRQRLATRALTLDAVNGPELNPRGLRRCLLLPSLIDPQQRCPGIDLPVHRRQHLTDRPGIRGTDRGLHLHRLEHHQRLTGLDLITDRDRDSNYHRRSRRTHQPRFVLTDLMRNPIDLDQEMRGTSNRDHGEAAIPQSHTALVVSEAFDLDLQITTVPVDLVAVRSDLTDTELVGLTLITELHRPPDGVTGPRTTTASRGQERSPLAGLAGIVGIDRSSDDRDIGMHRRTDRGPRIGAIEPPGIRGRRDDLFFVEQTQEEGLGGGAAVDDDRGLAQGVAQPRERLVTVPAPRDDLRDHRIVVRGNDIALSDTGVDTDTGTERELEQFHTARCRRETIVGVLGVEPGFHSMTELARALTLESPTVGDEDLQLHQIDTGGELGDRMLDLQTGVDLEEGEDLLLRLIQVLHRPRTGIPRSTNQLRGHRPQVIGLLLTQQR